VTGRASLLAFVAATGCVHLLPVLPGAGIRVALFLALLVITGMALGCRHRLPAGSLWLLLPLWAALVGFLLTLFRADARLAEFLPEADVNRVSRVELRVGSLPRQGTGMQTFDADVIHSIPAGVPARIRVSWRTAAWAGPYAGKQPADPDAPTVVPGQVWRMALVMRPPHGSRNPHGFDYEAWLFAQGVRAMGTVRGEPELLHDDPWHSLGIVAERARFAVREKMAPHLQGMRYGAVLLALAIGDQASVDADDWDVFNRTGITHLVSISGTHVTMIAGIGGVLASFLWRRVRVRGRVLAERLPAQVAGALFALLIAWLYCLLAGWGVPAQRTFLMLAIAALAYILRISIAASQLLAVAAFAVVLMDPWALLASGFWLSFGAVAVLMAMANAAGSKVRSGKAGCWQRMRRAGVAAARLQLMISAALLPALAVLFNEVSIASPLANAYAIPVISLLVTPLALLGALVSVIPGAQGFAAWVVMCAHTVLEWMMWPTRWLADQPIASLAVASGPFWLTGLALAGLVCVMAPRGLPGAMRAWALVLPALWWLPARPPHGSWDAVALDVGQAAAIVVQTSRHTLLFDTGVRHNATTESGSRVIWPYLRSQGVRHLDGLVVSHADIDHVGGLRGILDAMPVTQGFASFDVGQWLRREASMLGIPDETPRPAVLGPCHAGQSWTVDGVEFEFIWPAGRMFSPLQTASRERNDRSCVLSIRGSHHSLLLTGDISSTPERELLRRGLGQHDIVVVAHHGSNSSSSAAFVDTAGARHAIVQAGAWSRYGHPHPGVVRRWDRAGAVVWRNDLDGAVIMKSRQSGLHVTAERDRKQRYWQSW